MIDIQVDTSRLEAAIAEFAAASGKDLEAAFRQAGGTMVGQLIGVTPPAHKETLSEAGGVTLAAKKAGEARVASDIAKIFPTSSIKEENMRGMVESGYKWVAANGRRYAVAQVALSAGQLKQLHRQARNPRTGRTNAANGANMAVTRSAIRRAYIKGEIKKVGLLSAGWINAARELKTGSRYVPAWIKRHRPGPGGADVRNRGGKIHIRIYNSNRWFAGNWNRRLEYVVSRTEKAMTKAAVAILERKARAAERRMGR